MDGKIDYSKYSDRELQQAAESIDAARYPKNHENLIRERERRLLAQPHSTTAQAAFLGDPVWPEQRPGDDNPAARLWQYVALFALVYYASIAVIVIIGLQLETSGNAPSGLWFIFLGGLIVGRRFVAKHRRLFYAHEAHRLVLFCLLVVLALDAVIVLVRSEELAQLDLVWSVGIVLLQFAVDALLVWVAFRVVARRDMLKRLKALGL